MDGRGRRVDVCNGGPWSIPSPRVVVVGVAAAATVAVVGGGGLLGERGERREVSTP